MWDGICLCLSLSPCYVGVVRLFCACYDPSAAMDADVITQEPGRGMPGNARILPRTVVPAIHFFRLPRRITRQHMFFACCSPAGVAQTARVTFSHCARSSALDAMTGDLACCAQRWPLQRPPAMAVSPWWFQRLPFRGAQPSLRSIALSSGFTLCCLTTAAPPPIAMYIRTYSTSSVSIWLSFPAAGTAGVLAFCRKTCRTWKQFIRRNGNQANSRNSCGSAAGPGTCSHLFPYRAFFGIWRVIQTEGMTSRYC